jgi:hypothetical protein
MLLFCPIDVLRTLNFVYLTYITNYSMQQSPSWKAETLSASQEIPRLSWNPKVHYRDHKTPELVHIINHMNPVHILLPCFLSCILILSSHLRLDLPSGFDHSCYMIRPSHPLDLITLIIFASAYRLWSSSLCSLIQPPPLLPSDDQIFSPAPPHTQNI